MRLLTLTLWRQARVGEIGRSIGYESEAAFSRAYKALFGHSPRGDYKTDRRPEMRVNGDHGAGPVSL